MAQKQNPGKERTMRFYVLRSLSGKELAVCEEIEQLKERNPFVKEHVGRVVVPMQKVTIQRNGKKIVKEKPLITGYVMVELDLEMDLQSILSNLPNVFNFITVKLDKGTKEVPAPIAPAEVDRMLGAADREAESDGESEVTYTVGDTVRITDGAFTDFDAVVEEVISDKKKLKVMVKIFGRKTPLELSYAQVTKE